MDSELPFQIKYQSRIKALTFVAILLGTAGCLTADWEHLYGENHVFSGVKPALKRYLSDMLGGAASDPAKESVKRSSSNK